ncbi:MAG: hypothetical protein ACJA04_000710 [Cellvibrionaceae bacterium]|jgi:hypothetical protein
MVPITEHEFARARNKLAKAKGQWAFSVVKPSHHPSLFGYYRLQTNIFVKLMKNSGQTLARMRDC